VKDGVVTKYISSANMKIAQIKGTETSYYHRDHLGSSAVMTNAAGVKVEATEYAPYGTIREHTGTAVTDYRYTGKELDTATNLYYYGARYYDPMIGRFVTPDPILAAYIQNGGVYKPVNLNLYHYAANNPLIYVDPNGLWTAGIHFTSTYNAAIQNGFSPVASFVMAWSSAAVDYLPFMFWAPTWLTGNPDMHVLNNDTRMVGVWTERGNTFRQNTSYYSSLGCPLGGALAGINSVLSLVCYGFAGHTVGDNSAHMGKTEPKKLGSLPLTWREHSQKPHEDPDIISNNPNGYAQLSKDMYNYVNSVSSINVSNVSRVATQNPPPVAT